MGRIFEAQIQGFRQCSVNWEAAAAPLVDISNFERKPDQGYGNTDTKAEQIDTDTYADTKADQTADTYSDDSSAVKITQQTYTDDNSKLVSTQDTDSYAQDTSADIVEEKNDSSGTY